MNPMNRMRMRPEFELLNVQFWRLRNNEDGDLDQEVLKKIRDNVLLCEHIAQTDIEERMIFRTKYWWNRRASVFGMGMETKLLPAALGEPTVPTEKKYTAEDRKFLRSFGISSDGLPEDEDKGGK